MPETATKAKPILFSGPMVRAILEGRKSQTRRVVKPQPPSHWSIPPARIVDGKLCRFGNASDPDSIACPYGQPGDRLYVKERWATHEAFDGLPPRMIPEGEAVFFLDGREMREADGSWLRNKFAGRWRSPLHMPRWASRLTLEITGERCERVQDITAADVAAEGTPGMVCGKYQCSQCNGAGRNHTWPDGCPHCEPKGSGLNHTQKFRALWDSINGKTYPWASNPWVWVIEFKRIDEQGAKA